MKLSKTCRILFMVCLASCHPLSARPPGFASRPPSQIKTGDWIKHCDSLRMENHYPALQKAALEGLKQTPLDDAQDRATFFYYAALGIYYQVKFDSAQYYFYQSLHEAQRIGSFRLIANACIALIPVNFQLRQPLKVDSCKAILQNILDTTRNPGVLEDGYSALGTYYQEKSYYTSAQEYFIKSIELRKGQVDTTSDMKSKADYAIQCYALYKLYNTTGVIGKGYAMLNEGRRFMQASPVVQIRYLSAYVEVFTALGNIDSALYYLGQLRQRVRNSPTVPSELVASQLNIAQFYIDRKAYKQSLPFIRVSDDLAERSQSPILLYQAQMIDGRYFQETGQYDRAIKALAGSLPVARQISKEEYANDLKYMALAQRGAGHEREAWSFYRQYVQQLDTLTRETISRNFADQETRYETHEKVERIALLNRENRVRGLKLQAAAHETVLLILGMVALGIIALLFYFIYRNKEKLNKLLNDKHKTLDEVNRKLAMANHTKAVLFGIISHDLRSPVGKIVQLMQLQNARPSLLSPAVARSLEQKLKTSLENVLETMEDLLIWSKSQMEHFTPQFIRVDITAILQRELRILRFQIEDKQLVVKTQLTDRIFQDSDENFVTIIIRNLLQNAIDHSPAGSIIHIRTTQTALYITNPSTQAIADSLNDILLDGRPDSKSSGLGLQMARDLAVTIHVRLFFSQEQAHCLTAVLSWRCAPAV